MKRLITDTSSSAVTAGLLAVLVGWAGPNVLIYSVQRAAGLPDAVTWSWLWAHAVFTGVSSIYLSLRFRQPILSTWSTPGIAFLVTALPGIPFAEAIGAFIVSGVLVLLLGLVRPLSSLLARMPAHLAAALNAAILLPFALHVATSALVLPVVVLAMVVAYFVMREVSPTWAVAAVLVVGVVASVLTGNLHPAAVSFAPTIPQFVVPEFSVRAVVSLALPLTLIAFTGQFLPGYAALKTQGYHPNLGSILRTCGLASVGAAFFGCHNLTISALLANMVTGPDTHPDSARRYPAAVWFGLGNIVVGLFAATALQLLGILPEPAVATLAGLALTASLGASLSAALEPAAQHRPGSLAVVVVIAVTVSGIASWGIGSAFWGIVAGLAVHAVERYWPRRALAPVTRSPAFSADPDSDNSGEWEAEGAQSR